MRRTKAAQIYEKGGKPSVATVGSKGWFVASRASPRFVKLSPKPANRTESASNPKIPPIYGNLRPLGRWISCGVPSALLRQITYLPLDQTEAVLQFLTRIEVEQILLRERPVR